MENMDNPWKFEESEAKIESINRRINNFVQSKHKLDQMNSAFNPNQFFKEVGCNENQFIKRIEEIPQNEEKENKEEIDIVPLNSTAEPENNNIEEFNLTYDRSLTPIENLTELCSYYIDKENLEYSFFKELLESLKLNITVLPPTQDKNIQVEIKNEEEKIKEKNNYNIEEANIKIQNQNVIISKLQNIVSSQKLTFNEKIELYKQRLFERSSISDDNDYDG